MSVGNDKKIFSSTWDDFVKWRTNGQLKKWFSLLVKVNADSTDISTWVGFTDGRYDDWKEHDKSAVLATMQFLLWNICNKYPEELDNFKK